MSVSVAASVDTSAASAAAGPQLPPEIAKLGTPDEVFDLAAAKHSSQTSRRLPGSDGGVPGDGGAAGRVRN